MLSVLLYQTDTHHSWDVGWFLVTQRFHCLNTDLCTVCSFTHSLHGSFLSAKQAASLCAGNIKYGFLQCLMLPVSPVTRIIQA